MNTTLIIYFSNIKLFTISIENIKVFILAFKYKLILHNSKPYLAPTASAKFFSNL